MTTRLNKAALSLALLALAALTAHAQVPNLVNYQGRIAVGTTNFNGTGQFKFALVNTNGTTTHWSNNGSSTAGSQPTAAVSLTVTKGLYSVLLGDTSLTNMTALPAGVWTNADVRLRVWFNDGTTGFQLLTPDQRLAPNGYLPDGTVTGAKIANGAVGSSQLDLSTIGLWQTDGVSIYNMDNNVGVGTPTPAVKLHVRGGSEATLAANTGYLMVGSPTGLSVNLDFKQIQTRLGTTVTPFSINRLGGNVLLNETAGNVGIGTPAPLDKFHVAGGAIRVQGQTATDGYVALYAGDASAQGNISFYKPGNPPVRVAYIGYSTAAGSNDFGVSVLNGANFRINGETVSNGEMTCVAMNLTSDRNAKEQFKPVNARAVLDKVSRLPITEWQYKDNGNPNVADARHIGPMAQDFHEAFALGHDDKHITSVDADGVALAAIKGLNEKVDERDAEIDRLQSENEKLAARLAEIEKKLGMSGRKAPSR